MSKQYEDSELQKDPPRSILENSEEDLASEASENQKPKGVTRRKFVALAGTLLAATTLGTSGRKQHRCGISCFRRLSHRG